jgi:hypothetical protein
MVVSSVSVFTYLVTTTTSTYLCTKVSHPDDLHVIYLPSNHLLSWLAKGPTPCSIDHNVKSDVNLTVGVHPPQSQNRLSMDGALMTVGCLVLVIHS